MKRSPALSCSKCIFTPLLFTVLALTGCGKPASTPVPVHRAASAPERTLVLLTYPDYLAPGVLERFEAATGIHVHYESFDVVEEMRAKLESQPGNYDVVIADQSACDNLRNLRLIRPFDAQKLDPLEPLDPRFSAGIPPGAERFFVPYLWGTTILAYRADKVEVKPEERSWSLFWDRRFRGRALFSSESCDLAALGLLSLGWPTERPDPARLGQAIDHLHRAVVENDAGLGDPWSNLQRLDDGEIWLTQCYSGDAARFAVQNEKIRYFLPKEGAELWMDGFMLVYASFRSPDAHRFVNFMVQPAIAALAANYTRYLTPYQMSLPMLDNGLLSDETLNPPPEVLEKCGVFVSPDVERLPQLRNRIHQIHLAAEAKRASRPPADPSVSPTGEVTE